MTRRIIKEWEFNCVDGVVKIEYENDFAIQTNVFSNQNKLLFNDKILETVYDTFHQEDVEMLFYQIKGIYHLYCKDYNDLRELIKLIVSIHNKSNYKLNECIELVQPIIKIKYC